MSVIKFCLDCDHEVDLGLSPELSHRVTCSNCGVTMEVINTDPVELDWVYDGPLMIPPGFVDWWITSQSSEPDAATRWAQR